MSAIAQASSTAPDVSVIIVSADSGAGLADCVDRIMQAATATKLELCLIDNGSTDGIPQQIQHSWQHEPQVRVLFNQANLGFGPAVNRAAAQARGNYLLILNPDCLIDPDTLPCLLAVCRGAARPGLIGAVVCDAQGEPDPASYRRDPLVQRALNTMLGRVDEAAGRQGVSMPPPIPFDTVPAEAVSGALMLLPRPLFRQLGGFDERYFLHCEDLDLCRRVRDAGYQVLLAGGVRVLHGKGGSSRHRPIFVSYHKHRGMWRWFRKFDPAARRPWLAGLVWIGLWLHFALAIPGQWLRRVSR